MPIIKVDTDVLKKCESELGDIYRSIKRTRDGFYSIYNNLDWDIRCASNINSRLQGISSELDDENRRISAMQSFLGFAADKYENGDRNYCPIAKSVAHGVSNAVWLDVVPDRDSELNYLEYENFFHYTDKKGKRKETKIKQDEKRNEKIKSFNEKVKKYNKGEKENWYKKKGTILEGSYEESLEGSVFVSRSPGKNGSSEVKIGTGEVHGKVSGGLYIFEKDKNGKTKRILSPSVDAEIGASVSLIEASAEGRIGFGGQDKDTLGLYGDVNAKAGSADAKLGIQASKDQVHVSAKAEADVVKLEASGGVTVLGADIGVKGSVKVGVGFHADVGYTDGKVKVDIGAAIGLGADIGFEVDVKKTVKAVCGFAKSIIPWLK